MRPANLAPDRLPNARAIVAAQTESYVASPTENPASVLASLYDHAGWSRRAAALIADLGETGTERTTPDRLADGFVLPPPRFGISSRIRSCPELEPEGWPARHLRTAYGSYLGDYQAGLRGSSAATRCPMRRFLGSRGTALRPMSDLLLPSAALGP